MQALEILGEYKVYKKFLGYKRIEKDSLKFEVIVKHLN